MFRDHGTITSYYEKYYGVITITSYYETYYGVITIRYVLSLLYQEMLGLSRRNPQGNLPKFIPLLTARMLLTSTQAKQNTLNGNKTAFIHY